MRKPFLESRHCHLQTDVFIGRCCRQSLIGTFEVLQKCWRSNSGDSAVGRYQKDIDGKIIKRRERPCCLANFGRGGWHPVRNGSPSHSGKHKDLEHRASPDTALPGKRATFQWHQNQHYIVVWHHTRRTKSLDADGTNPCCSIRSPGVYDCSRMGQPNKGTPAF